MNFIMMQYKQNFTYILNSQAGDGCIIRHIFPHKILKSHINWVSLKAIALKNTPEMKNRCKMKKLPVQDIFPDKSSSVNSVTGITPFNESGYGKQGNSNL
jgi:hypothetical protein